jgi:hypothetical protein
MAPPFGKASTLPTDATTPPMALPVEPAAARSVESAERKFPSPVLIRVAVLLVLIGGVFLAWRHFAAGTDTPAPDPQTAPAAKAPAAAAPKAPATPSEPANQLAHAPANAIAKAKAAIAAHQNSGQAQVDPLTAGEAPVAAADAVAGPTAPGAKAAKPSTSGPATSASIAPGVAATAAQVQAVPDASAPFRSYVANAKVNGVFQGPPARAMINGRLTRTGELVDSALGITFNGVDPDRRFLLFVDRSGATVTRRF